MGPVTKMARYETINLSRCRNPSLNEFVVMNRDGNWRG